MWAHAAKHYDEDQLTALVVLVSFMNAVNRLNIITRQPAGNYRQGSSIERWREMPGAWGCFGPESFIG